MCPDCETPTPQEDPWGSATQLRLPLAGEPLDLRSTLGCGQAFRWRPLDDGGEEWEGVVGGRAWRIRVEGDVLAARVLPAGDLAGAAEFLWHYFALDESLRLVQASFAGGHPAAVAAIDRYPGLRVLRQEPIETFLSFGIASATNVPRIQRCLEAMARHYGRPLLPGGEAGYFHFPTPAAIMSAEVDHLAGPCNLAYRARSLVAATAVLMERGAGWLDDLARGPYPAARDALDDLPGIGPKIADCICLFGLGFDQAVPIDTHVWAITHELFGTEVPSRTLTPRTYDYLGDLWRDRFGRYAGWAQQYLFQMRRDQPIGERFRP